MLTATYLINQNTPILHMHPMYEITFGITLNYSFLHIFSCLCYPNLCSYVTNKLTSHSEHCVFLGYSSQHLRHQCLSLEHASCLSPLMSFLTNLSFLMIVIPLCLLPPPPPRLGFSAPYPSLLSLLWHPLPHHCQPLHLMTSHLLSLLTQLLPPYL